MESCLKVYTGCIFPLLHCLLYYERLDTNHGKYLALRCYQSNIIIDVPGPGHYDPKDQLSSKKFNNVFVSEDREKYSLFKTIQKKSDELPAPSNYTINNNFSKKSYNATLPPKKFV